MTSTARGLAALFLLASVAGFGTGTVAQMPEGPAARRLYNGYRPAPPCCPGVRCTTLPPINPGLPWENPPCTGKDDPWRPPHIWPKTRYPVVPPYGRPNYGYYETSWRLIPIADSGSRPMRSGTPGSARPAPAANAETMNPAVSPSTPAEQSPLTPTDAPPGKGAAPRPTTPPTRQPLPAPTPKKEPKVTEAETELPPRSAMIVAPDGDATIATPAF